MSQQKFWQSNLNFQNSIVVAFSQENSGFGRLSSLPPKPSIHRKILLLLSSHRLGINSKTILWGYLEINPLAINSNEIFGVIV